MKIRKINAKSKVTYLSTKDLPTELGKAKGELKSRINSLGIDGNIVSKYQSQVDDLGNLDKDLKTLVDRVNTDVDKLASGAHVISIKKGDKVEYLVQTEDEMIEKLNKVKETNEKIKQLNEEREQASKERKAEIKEELKKKEAERQESYKYASDLVNSTADAAIKLTKGVISGDPDRMVDAILGALAGIFSLLPKGIALGVTSVRSAWDKRKANKKLKSEDIKKLEQVQLDVVSEGAINSDPMTPEELEEVNESYTESAFEDVGKITDWESAFKYGYAKLKQVHGVNFDEAKAKEVLEGLKAKYPDNPKVVIGALKYGGRRKKENVNKTEENNSRTLNSVPEGIYAVWEQMEEGHLLDVAYTGPFTSTEDAKSKLGFKYWTQEGGMKNRVTLVSKRYIPDFKFFVPVDEFIKDWNNALRGFSEVTSEIKTYLNMRKDFRHVNSKAFDNLPDDTKLKLIVTDGMPLGENKYTFEEVPKKVIKEVCVYPDSPFIAPYNRGKLCDNTLRGNTVSFLVNFLIEDSWLPKLLNYLRIHQVREIGESWRRINSYDDYRRMNSRALGNLIKKLKSLSPAISSFKGIFDETRISYDDVPIGFIFDSPENKEPIFTLTKQVDKYKTEELDSIENPKPEDILKSIESGYPDLVKNSPRVHKIADQINSLELPGVYASFSRGKVDIREVSDNGWNQSIGTLDIKESDNGLNFGAAFSTGYGQSYEVHKDSSTDLEGALGFILSDKNTGISRESTREKLMDITKEDKPSDKPDSNDSDKSLDVPESVKSYVDTAYKRDGFKRCYGYYMNQVRAAKRKGNEKSAAAWQLKADYLMSINKNSRVRNSRGKVFDFRRKINSSVPNADLLVADRYVGNADSDNYLDILSKIAKEIKEKFNVRRKFDTPEDFRTWTESESSISDRMYVMIDYILGAVTGMKSGVRKNSRLTNSTGYVLCAELWGDRDSRGLKSIEDYYILSESEAESRRKELSEYKSKDDEMEFLMLYTFPETEDGYSQLLKLLKSTGNAYPGMGVNTLKESIESRRPMSLNSRSVNSIPKESGDYNIYSAKNKSGVIEDYVVGRNSDEALSEVPPFSKKNITLKLVEEGYSANYADQRANELRENLPEVGNNSRSTNSKSKLLDTVSKLIPSDSNWDINEDTVDKVTLTRGSELLTLEYLDDENKYLLSDEKDVLYITSDLSKLVDATKKFI